MRRSAVASVSILVFVASLLTATAAAAARQSQEALLEVYTGEIDVGDVEEVLALGVDRHDLELSAARGDADGKSAVRVEAVLSADQARQLRRRGLDLRVKTVGGQTVTARATALAADGHDVFRPYLGDGGLKEEIEQVAADNPDITKLVSIGETVDGTDIQAVKVTRDAHEVRDGERPTTVYIGAQHAREWITPEMIRRLLRHVVDGYGTDPELTRLVGQTEMWFVPVANPDGYDFTFQPGQRLWRKNLRDNNGDGQITPGDGVDLNRNFPTKWGYDNEGSSPSPASETYRGPAPASEPETQALDAFIARLRPEFFVNYHSAAELLLYGVGWQVATPTPDDVIYEAMVGDDDDPAVPGYDPDISAELYITNGTTDEHMQVAYGTLGFTPEMSTCQTISDLYPDDDWDAADCGSVFEFPDDEELVEEEFQRNLPWALSVASSAPDPADPVSVVGRTAENFRVDAFEASHGDPQTVATWMNRALRGVLMRYRINGGRPHAVQVTEWDGGERYGGTHDDYYAEVRGVVSGADPGDTVEVWFSGARPGQGRVSSERFAYTVEEDSDAPVLVIANEDYTGVNPDYPDTVTAPTYADAHVAGLAAAGYDAEVWDVDAQGVPHDLGVLSHYDAILWYLGDNRITMDPGDLLTPTPFGPLPDISVAERQQYLTMAVRDFLNEGGKLIHAGETAQHEGLPGISDIVGGLYYGLNGAPDEECVVETVQGFFEDCLILANDFRQYYLGAMTRIDNANPVATAGVAEPIEGWSGTFGGPVAEAINPLDEAGWFTVTSDVLPPSEFPQFASHGAAEYVGAGGANPYAPVEGDRYAAAVHADDSYMRLAQTFDLSGATSAHLQLQLSHNVETSYDNVVVEAHTAGEDDWVTLPEVGGATSTTPPAECVAGGFLLQLHPFLERYLGGPDCTEGEWHALTGGSGGWQEVAFDLSAFAGDDVEVSISYVTDPLVGGIGVFVDDTRLVVDGAVTTADGFEDGASAWTAIGSPEGSPPNAGDWVIGPTASTVFAGTATEDTLLLGFGLEQLATDEARAALLSQALGNLLEGEG